MYVPSYVFENLLKLNGWLVLLALKLEFTIVRRPCIGKRKCISLGTLTKVITKNTSNVKKLFVGSNISHVTKHS